MSMVLCHMTSVDVAIQPNSSIPQRLNCPRRIPVWPVTRVHRLHLITSCTAPQDHAQPQS